MDNASMNIRRQFSWCTHRPCSNLATLFQYLPHFLEIETKSKRFLFIFCSTAMIPKLIKNWKTRKKMKIHADTLGLRRIYCHLIFFAVVNNHLYVPIAKNQEKKAPYSRSLRNAWSKKWKKTKVKCPCAFKIEFTSPTFSAIGIFTEYFLKILLPFWFI